MKFRMFASIIAALGVLAVPQIAAAQPKSTWDTILETRKLRLGCAQSEPWCFKDLTGSDAPGAVKSGGVVWRGVSAALGKEIADAMGVELEIVETTWGNGVSGLQSNQYDFMFQLDATPQRALAIDFASPAMWYPVALLAREELKGKSWEDLNDPKYKFGAPTGTSFVDVLKKNVPNATIITFQQSSEVLAAFQAGRVDAAVSTGPLADVSRLRLRMGETVVPTPVEARPTGAGVRKETDPRWRDYLQTAITYYYDTGKTQELYRDFLVFRGLDPKTAVSTRREDWQK